MTSGAICRGNGDESGLLAGEQAKLSIIRSCIQAGLGRAGYTASKILAVVTSALRPHSPAQSRQMAHQQSETEADGEGEDSLAPEPRHCARPHLVSRQALSRSQMETKPS